jgi:hypothetical protein
MSISSSGVAQYLTSNQRIEHLKLVIEKYRRMIFGSKSEKLQGQLEQLEFQLEELGALEGQEDVKKLIWRSFRDFSFEPKCIPTSQRSLLGHPGAAFFCAQFSQQLKTNFFTSSRRNNHPASRRTLGSQI